MKITGKQYDYVKHIADSHYKGNFSEAFRGLAGLDKIKNFENIK